MPPPLGQNTTPDPGFFSVNPIVVDVDLGPWSTLLLLELRYLDSPWKIGLQICVMFIS